MSKHYSNQLPATGVDVFAFHTPADSISQKQDWLKHNGNAWVYSLDDTPITGHVNAWYDTECEAAE